MEFYKGIISNNSIVKFFSITIAKFIPMDPKYNVIKGLHCIKEFVFSGYATNTKFWIRASPEALRYVLEQDT